MLKVSTTIILGSSQQIGKKLLCETFRPFNTSNTKKHVTSRRMPLIVKVCTDIYIYIYIYCLKHPDYLAVQVLPNYRPVLSNGTILSSVILQG